MSAGHGTWQRRGAGWVIGDFHRYLKTAKRIRKAKTGCFIVTEEAGGEKGRRRGRMKAQSAVDKPVAGG
ncbi:MAG: hypothetical protein ACLTK0_05520 [Anaerovoracaceae bacterium]